MDALLAVSAFCEEMYVFFVGDAVSQLVEGQQPKKILSRNYINTFKLMEVCDIENVYLCAESLIQFGLQDSRLIVDAKIKSSNEIADLMHCCSQIITF
ncbi:protein TusC [Candidatus Photodesmus blepharus]|uniref:Protein TusC homolog n=1 Tax=Candidatus Photodesmus blepharonis TaxID=1179155 RepID=A0A084CNQ3_9GAMM|nr:protein TusC [Candidatus Photodesmus blepharus]